MTRRYWWWRSLAGILMLAGVLGGCDDDDHHKDHHDGHFAHENHDDGPPARGQCVLFREREPNDTVLTAQFLDPGVAGDCASVEGSLAATTDVDSYRILIEETLTMLVTLDHSPGVDFNVRLFDADTDELIFNCGTAVVPEVCAVTFRVGSHALAVDVVVTSVGGAGPYTLTLDVQ
jgi:hypothetical protein